MAELDGFILVHWNASVSIGFFNFDVIVHQKHSEYEMTKDFGYSVDCPFVEKFLKKHKDYIYCGSEDLGHIPSNNFGILNFVADLVKQGLKPKWCGVNKK